MVIFEKLIVSNMVEVRRLYEKCIKRLYYFVKKSFLIKVWVSYIKKFGFDF